MVPATTGGSLDLDSAPSSATIGTTGTVSVSWSGLGVGTQYLGAVSHTGPEGLLVCLGAVATLLATTIGIERHGYFMAMWGWFIVWFIVQLSAIPAGITLPVSSEWRKLPLAARLDTSFGFFAVSWTAWLALVFRGWGTPLFILIVFVFPLGILLALSYWKYHRKVAEQAEELFP